MQRLVLTALALVAIALSSAARAQSPTLPGIDFPNPDSAATEFAACRRRVPGGTTAVAIDRDGKSVWVFERCGGSSCAEFKLPPILDFDPSGKLLPASAPGCSCFRTASRSIPRQRLGRRRRWQERQGPRRGEVQPNRQGAADLGQAGDAGRIRRGSSNAPTPGIAIAAMATSSWPRPRRHFDARVVKFLEGRPVRHGVGPQGNGTRRVRHAARHRRGFPEQRFDVRRPLEQPHPGVRRERHIDRRLEAVRPSERGLCRRARRDLRRRIPRHTTDKTGWHPPGAAATASAPAALRTAWCSRSFRGRTAIRSVRRCGSGRAGHRGTGASNEGKRIDRFSRKYPGVPAGRPAIG